MKITLIVAYLMTALGVIALPGKFPIPETCVEHGVTVPQQCPGLIMRLVEDSDEAVAYPASVDQSWIDSEA